MFLQDVSISFSFFPLPFSQVLFAFLWCFSNPLSYSIDPRCSYIYIYKLGISISRKAEGITRFGISSRFFISSDQHCQKKKHPTMASRSPVSNHFHVSDLTNYLNFVLRTWINRFPLSRACFDFNLCCRLVWNPWSVVSGELQTSLLLLLLRLVLKWSLPLLQHLNCLRSLKQGMMRFWWLNWRVINYLDLWFFWLNYEVFLLFVVCCFD